MQAPNIYQSDPGPEGETEYQKAQRLKTEREDNEQRDRVARFFIELPYFGKLQDVESLAEYLDRSVQLRFHDSSMHFEVKTERDFGAMFRGNVDPSPPPSSLGTFQINVAELAKVSGRSEREVANAISEFVVSFVPKEVWLGESKVVDLPGEVEVTHQVGLDTASAQNVCRLCGRGGGRHNFFCRLYEDDRSLDGGL